MHSAGSNPAIPRDKCSNLHAVCLGNDFISANLSKDIDKFYKICYNIYRKPDVAQLVEAMDMRLKDIDWGSTNISYH